MTLSTRQRITIASVTAGIGLILAVFALLGTFGGGVKIYFGLQNDIETLKQGQAATTQTLDKRASLVDGKLANIQQSITKVESAVAVSQNNQATLSQQIGQVQSDVRNLTNLLLKQRVAENRIDMNKQEVAY